MLETENWKHRRHWLTSSTTATLGMSGWLDLIQSGLAPNQKHQALFGAPKIVHCGTSISVHEAL
jgi:hypothetical protein